MKKKEKKFERQKFDENKIKMARKPENIQRKIWQGALRNVKDEKEILEKGQEKVRRKPSWRWICMECS